MTTANEEFADLMPHQIKVWGVSVVPKYDDWGKPINDPDLERTYMCLLDDNATTVRTATGIEITVTLTAYVAPVPIDSETNTPVDISEDESVEIMVPAKGIKQIISVERHFDSELGVGMLHNIVLRLN